MLGRVRIQVFEQNQLAFSDEYEGAVEIGRQSDPSEELYKGIAEGERSRIAIARLKEQFVSRRHALVEPIGVNRVRVTNMSSLIPLTIWDGTELPPLGNAEFNVPTTFSIGRKRIEISRGDDHQTALRSLPKSFESGSQELDSERLPKLELPRDGGDPPEALIRWLGTVMGVLQTAASSSDFFDRAARGVVDIVGLDCGRVLLFEGDGWQIEGFARGGTSINDSESFDNWRPSRRVLSRLRAEKRTFWEERDFNGGESLSLSGVSAVVASPILDSKGTVIGALYGERRQSTRGPLTEAPRVSQIEAMMIELLATGVATGLARIEQEKAALAARVQFEQFFTPELARELTARPDLLKGQEREVTLLFADIRGFSRISERIGPARTLEWIGDVMEALSDCVQNHSGVLVDYIGDELIAMWGAPVDEPAHARLASRAALDMLAVVPQLNTRWQAILGEPMAIGIGLNSGIAQVGNTGSSRKFKYGALGNTVNLASRVQGVTKFLKTELLVTGSTRAHLDSNFAVRLLCRVAVVNIAEPVELYELVACGRPGWEALRTGYEEALGLFERQEFRRAARTLAALLDEFPFDEPSLLLLSRSVECLVRVKEPSDFDPVWRLSGK